MPFHFKDTDTSLRSNFCEWGGGLFDAGPILLDESFHSFAATAAAVSTAAAAVTVSVCNYCKQEHYRKMETQNLTTVVGGGQVAAAWEMISAYPT